jgi:hypothetical protein
MLVLSKHKDILKFREHSEIRMLCIILFTT